MRYAVNTRMCFNLCKKYILMLFYGSEKCSYGSENE